MSAGISYSITTDIDNVSRALKEATSKAVPAFSKGLNAVTARGLRTVKESLGKRTGNLRSSYQQRQVDTLVRSIFSELKYARANEEGAAPKTIYPRRAKFLTIPLNDSVLTSTKAQISQTALNRLFSELKKSTKGMHLTPEQRQALRYSIMQRVGIILAKKANIPAIRGRYTLRDIVVPAITADLTQTMNQVILELFQ